MTLRNERQTRLLAIQKRSQSPFFREFTRVQKEILHIRANFGVRVNTMAVESDHRCKGQVGETATRLLPSQRPLFKDISRLVSVTRLDVFYKTSGQFPNMFVANRTR